MSAFPSELPADRPPRRARPVWLPYAALFVLLVATLCVAVHTVVRDAQRDEADELAGRLDAAVSRHLHELEAITTTVLGLHYGTSGFDESDLLTLAEQLRAESPFVEALGQVRAVRADERAKFERDMSERGLFDFHVNDLDAAGIARKSPERGRHYPIAMLEPMSPANLNAIGADLGTLPHFASDLSRSIENHEPFLAVLPENWPFAGRLLHVKPAFDDEDVGTRGAGERARRFESGYWIVGDLASALAGIEGTDSDFTVTLGVDNGAERRVAARRSFGGDSRRLLTFLFDEDVREWRRDIGSTSLVTTLSGRAGLTTGYLFGTLAAATLFLAIALSLASDARARRLRALELGRASTALLAERQKAEITLDSIADAVVTLDRSHRVVHLNAAAVTVLGRTRARVLGMPIADLLSFREPDGDDVFDLDAALDAVPATGRVERDLVPPSGPQGEKRVTRLTLTRTPPTPEGETGSIIVVLRDISAEASFTRRLAHQANHDQLTGCTNRYYFENRLGELVASLPGSGRQHALCYVDLDQFKVVNDTCGHAAGDRLLCELTDNLQAMIRSEDVLSRLGGDEFGLLIVDADRACAERIAEGILTFFQSFVFRCDDRAFAVRASIGFVPVDEESGDIGEILSAADKACYAAKEGGRDSLYVYDPDDAVLVERATELNWLPKLRSALDEDRFRLLVQPIASIGPSRPGGHVTHFEFLLRMIDEAGAEIAPWQFIKAAERYDLMREVDRWVIRHALESIAAIGDGAGTDCSWSINLSGQSVADPTLVDYVLEEVNRTGVPFEKIWFELTETAAITHFSIAKELIERVRGLGAKMVLDDFGSGLSSFGYLKNLPVDMLKIDGQFVRDIARSPVDREMVAAICRVAAAMDIETVAEFVEDQASLDELVAIGVDYAQGYYLGRPVSLTDALARLEPIDRAA